MFAELCITREFRKIEDYGSAVTTKTAQTVDAPLSREALCANAKAVICEEDVDKSRVLINQGVRINADEI